MSKIQDASRLNILYKVCSAHKYNMAYWLTIPEFVDEMLSLREQGVLFNDQNVLDVMQRIYNEKDENRALYPDFNFSTARQAINQIQRAL